jgi:hypothetical protein
VSNEVLVTPANIEWYFLHDEHPGHRIDLGLSGFPGLKIKLRGYLDFASNSKFLSCFVPRHPDTAKAALTLIRQVEQLLLHAFDGVEMTLSHESGNDPPRSSKELHFTGRTFLYLDTTLSPGDRQVLVDESKKAGLYVHIRDATYADSLKDLVKPQAFICHDSRDKEAVVRPLANILARAGVILWHDEYSLKIGDSLRESVEDGIKTCGRCIVVLSKHFVANSGWTKREFNAVFTREILEKANIILPVWHDVSSEEVYEYSPNLLDRFAANTSDGLEAVSRKLVEALRQQKTQ